MRCGAVGLASIARVASRRVASLAAKEGRAKKGKEPEARTRRHLPSLPGPARQFRSRRASSDRKGRAPTPWPVSKAHLGRAGERRTRARTTESEKGRAGEKGGERETEGGSAVSVGRGVRAQCRVPPVSEHRPVSRPQHSLRSSSSSSARSVEGDRRKRKRNQTRNRKGERERVRDSESEASGVKRRDDRDGLALASTHRRKEGRKEGRQEEAKRKQGRSRASRRWPAKGQGRKREEAKEIRRPE